MSLRVMVVDDDPPVLKLIKFMLEPLGCEVEPLSDSQEAARRVGAEKYDGIVLDAHMPQPDGFELTALARKSAVNHATPIVMLTGLDDVATMRRGFQAGATCFLGKPVSQERLTTLIKAMRGPLLTEKRRHARLPLRTPVECKPGPRFERRFVAASSSISEGGISFGPSGGLAVEQQVEVEFAIPGAPKPVRVRGHVVRVEMTDRVAVAFTELSDADRKAIRGYVGERVKL